MVGTAPPQQHHTHTHTTPLHTQQRALFRRATAPSKQEAVGFLRAETGVKILPFDALCSLGSGMNAALEQQTTGSAQLRQCGPFMHASRVMSANSCSSDERDALAHAECSDPGPRRHGCKSMAPDLYGRSHALLTETLVLRQHRDSRLKGNNVCRPKSQWNGKQLLRTRRPGNAVTKASCSRVNHLHCR